MNPIQLFIPPRYRDLARHLSHMNRDLPLQESYARINQYKSILAVLTFHDYCRIMGISTHLDSSPNLDGVLSLTCDRGELPLSNGQILECLVIDTNQTEIEIPVPGSERSVAWVAISIDTNHNQALLHGFSSVFVTQLNLNQEIQFNLLDLEDLYKLSEFLESHCSQKYCLEKSHISDLNISNMSTNLGKWLNQEISLGWRVIGKDLISELENAYHRLYGHPDFVFRGSTNNVPSRKINVAQILTNDNPEWQKREINLAVALSIETFQDNSDLMIYLRLMPLEPLRQLPTGLNIELLDSDHQPVHHTLVTESSEVPQLTLKFKLPLDDCFSIRVSHDDLVYEKEFIYNNLDDVNS